VGPNRLEVATQGKAKEDTTNPTRTYNPDEKD